MISLSLRPNFPTAQARGPPVIANRDKSPARKEQETPIQRAINDLYALLRNPESFKDIPTLILKSRIPEETWTRAVRVDGAIRMNASGRMPDAMKLEKIILKSDLGPAYESHASPDALAMVRRPSPELAIA